MQYAQWNAPTLSLLVAHAVDATRSGDAADGDGSFLGMPLKPNIPSNRSTINAINIRIV